MASTSGNTGLSDIDPVAAELCPAQRKDSTSRLRLSWPRRDDARRAIVSKSTPGNKDNRQTRIGDTRIIHVSQQDLEMHYRITSAMSTGSLPVLDVPLGHNPIELEVGHQHLFRYFQETASRSLAIFGHDPTELGNMLVRTALVSNSPSATAVLQSILAISALHLNGVCAQAFELKMSALRALMTPLEYSLGATEAIQHVAAGMLILSFEIHQASCTSGEWTCYLLGVKKVIETARLHDYSQDSDTAMLLDWVYYHDVLARFSLRHWHRKSSGWSTPSRGTTPDQPDLSSFIHVRARVSQAPPPALTAIELLSQVCDAVSTAHHPAETSLDNLRDQKSFLEILDWRIRSLRMTARISSEEDGTSVMELYQLAVLVYLSRASGRLLNHAVRTQKQIERAFEMISTLHFCDQQFPVFIFGCEARSDDQRAKILDLISRTESSASSRSFNHLRMVVQAIWAQDDLADKEASYTDRFDKVISRTWIMPSFV